MLRLASLLVAVCLVTMLVAMLRRPGTAARIDQSFAAANGQGTVVPMATDVAAAEIVAPPMDPAAFRKILDLAGWNSARLAGLADEQPLTDPQREELLYLLRRLNSFDAADLESWARNDVSIDAVASNPDEHRGQLVRLAGRVKHVTRRTLPPELAARLEMPAYIECELALDGDTGTATIITARVPDAWLKMESLDEPAAAEGIFVKLLPSENEKPAALFVSRDVAWRPRDARPPYVSYDESVLGSLGMDVGLLDAVQQRRPIRAQERDAFYAMLAAAKRIGVNQLVRLASGNLPAVREAWSAEETQLADDPTAADQKQLILAREVVARAEQGKYSVAPLFNEPGEQVGNLVLLDGLARRAVRVDVGTLPNGRPSDVARRFGIDHYYEMEIFTDDSQNNPIVFCAVELPEGFPTGESIREQVRAAGFFFKSWSYESRRAGRPNDEGQATPPVAVGQFAPLVIGHGPVWIQPPVTTGPDYTALLLAGLFALMLAAVWIIGWWFARDDRRFAERMLADRFTLPPGESLNDLELSLRARCGDDAKILTRMESMSNAAESSDVPPYSHSPRHAYPWWAPRFWHGMRLPTWLKLMARNRFAISPSRLPLALSITNVTMINMFASVFDQLVMGHKVRATELAEPPLFVLGHWRSGTTLLHELLILDERHTYPNTYECFAPHHFLWTEWFVPPLLSWVLPSTRPMDNMPAGWDRPQEDEFALCNLGIPSPYLAWAFPNHGTVADDYLDLVSLSERDREKWKAALERFVKRVAAVRNKRIVLKSPTHTARVRTLLEIFPDARFVHIVRHPLALFPSTIRLWTTLSQVQGMQTVDGEIPWVEGFVLDQFVRMYERFEQDRDLIPAGRLAEVRYEELAADPVGQMRQVYEQLDLGDFRRVQGAIATYAATHSKYRPNRYSLPPATAQRVRRYWAPYFERYGYADEDANVAMV